MYTVTLKWKESEPPVIVHWWNELSSYLTLDSIYYRSKGRSSDFLKLWQSHIEFTFMSVLGQYKAYRYIRQWVISHFFGLFYFLFLLSVSVVFRGYIFVYYLGSLIVVYKIYKKKKTEICLMFFCHPPKMTLSICLRIRHLCCNFNEANNITCKYSPPPSSELLKITNLVLLGLVQSCLQTQKYF